MSKNRFKYAANTKNLAESSRDFPADFVWGAATSPPCAEGETVSDWAKLSAPDGSVPDDGPRHWRRYRFDFQVMRDLSLRAYRFGCDWGRLQRKPYDPLNRDDLFRYLEMFAELRGHGIEPWLVLFDHALPRWVSKAGGWLNPETPHWFADFARRLAYATDGEVRHWIPVSRPNHYAFASHAWGQYPEGSWGRPDRVRTVLKQLHRGHELAVACIRNRVPEAKIGVEFTGGTPLARRIWHPGDWLGASWAGWFLESYGQRAYFRGIGACDFVVHGIGNETPVRVGDAVSLSSLVSPALAGRTDTHGGGRSVSTRRRRLARLVRRSRVPVYFMGRGHGGGNAGGLDELLPALAGSGAAGFFYSPLLDQFDLHHGLSGGGGLLRVDFHGYDRRRDLRPFAFRLAAVAESGSLAPLIGKGTTS